MFDDNLHNLGDELRRTAPPPNFEDVRRRTRRMRHSRSAATGIAVAVIIGASVASTQVIRAQGDHPVPPASPTQTTTTTSAHLTPTPEPSPTNPASSQDHSASLAEIVDAPKAVLLELAVDPDDPQVRAAVWRLHPHGMVLAVTHDGFSTRSLSRIRGGANIVAIGHDQFFVSSRAGSGYLINVAGKPRVLALAHHRSPVRKGEILVQDSAGGWLAVNPTDVTAHRPLLPPHQRKLGGVTELHQPEPGGTFVWGITTAAEPNSAVLRGKVAWSTNGGRTWSSKTLPKGPNYVYEGIPTYRRGSMAVYRSGDGATLDPFGPIFRTTDSGRSWTHVDHRPGGVTAYDSWAVIRSDGSLLVDVVGWSDDPAGELCTHRPCGLYQSNGTDWSDLTPLHVTLPEDLPNQLSLRGGSQLLSPTVGDGRLFVSVGYDPEVTLVSTDGGHTWRRTPSR